MRRSAIGLSALGAFLLSFVFMTVVHVRAHDDDRDDSRVRQGLRIAPVPLDLRGKNRGLVGKGSYLVNAVGACADCHSCPTYEPGHNPYGPPSSPLPPGDGQLNAKNYLAGGVLFAPPGVTSANLTPDPKTGRPELGHTFAEFKHLIRTGHDPEEGNRILQVMPWPVYRHMTDEDLRAIYEFLSAIPHAEPGRCFAPGQ
jgi:cytochrome c553